jgi:hypothetical protein
LSNLSLRRRSADRGNSKPIEKAKRRGPSEQGADGYSGPQTSAAKPKFDLRDDPHPDCIAARDSREQLAQEKPTQGLALGNAHAARVIEITSLDS